MSAALRAAFAARAGRLSVDAVARVAAAIAARFAVEVPDIRTEINEAEVRLSAPGLRVRVFGSRKRAADPRLAAIARGME